MKTKNDLLDNAASSAGLIRDSLRAALESANPVESLLLLDLIRDAAVLQNKISNLLAAIKQDKVAS